MRIATFNANSIRSRFSVLTKWLQLHQPDILAIQETKVQDVDFPLSDFGQTGYHIVFRGQKKYNGVAILSKAKPTEVLSTLQQDSTDQARFLKARIGNVTLINTYIPQGAAIDSDKFQYTLDWFRWL
jgi:exodeoxyribonuclease-3